MPGSDQFRQSAKNLSDRASSAAEDFSETASRAAQKITDAAGTASEEIAVQVAGQARAMTEETLTSRRDRAEHYLGAITSAIKAGSKSLEDDGLHVTASYTRQAADLVEGMTTQIDDIDIQSATGRVENFMRTRPVVSFGTAMLLGFTAYQLLKSRPQVGGRKGGAE